MSAADSLAGLHRPTPVYDPNKSLLHNDHFQIAYVTNDIERAVTLFRDRFGVQSFRSSDNELPNGARISIRSAWIGGMMYEICCGAGPGMELYTDWVRADGRSMTPVTAALGLLSGAEFVLRFHHFGYLVPDDVAWDALERQIQRGGWKVRTRSDFEGFFRGCYIEAPELGHFLEFVQPRAAMIARLNATPVS